VVQLRRLDRLLPRLLVLVVEDHIGLHPGKRLLRRLLGRLRLVHHLEGGCLRPRRGDGGGGLALGALDLLAGRGVGGVELRGATGADDGDRHGKTPRGPQEFPECTAKAAEVEEATGVLMEVLQSRKRLRAPKPLAALQYHAAYPTPSARPSG